MKILESEYTLGEVIPNIALLMQYNAAKYPEKDIFCEKNEGDYHGISWSAFYKKIQYIAANLTSFGFQAGDKMIVFSPNRQEMLELEIAVMSCGGISVPIFAYFHKETAEMIIRHSSAQFITVAGILQLSRISEALPVKHVFVFDDVEDARFNNLHSYTELTQPVYSPFSLHYHANADEICLNMYTSGTMGTPKCVQLTHRNILSQQAALNQSWTRQFHLNEDDRFLSYLPWHHSFGGIFERFTALYHGATIFLESGFGKNPDILFENWKIVRPTLFFSVPKIYQSLLEIVKDKPGAWDQLFHLDLKFVFTAAASLPKKISDEFEKRNIPVIEGWGLTETSPCCTLTDHRLKRENGVVGKPLAGITIRIDDEGEIQVKGPNVMKGYFNNNEANKDTFTTDGWYRTGDIGDLTENGLKLISRKDRIFKLTNGEKVIPSEMENLIQSKCHYIMHALVVGNGNEYPVAILFPNKKLLTNPNYELSPEEGCFCPRDLSELRKCLQGCLHDTNCSIAQKFSKIKYALIIDDELSIENSTLTPSMKMAPKMVIDAYKAQIENMYGNENSFREDVYLIKLNTENLVSRVKTEI